MFSVALYHNRLETFCKTDSLRLPAVWLVGFWLAGMVTLRGNVLIKDGGGDGAEGGI